MVGNTRRFDQETPTAGMAGSGSQPETNEDDEEEAKKRKSKDESNKTVPFYKLFSYADTSDRMLMLIGAVAAVANGMSVPLMTIILGDAMDAFGINSSDTKKVVHHVSKVNNTSKLINILLVPKLLYDHCLFRI